MVKVIDYGGKTLYQCKECGFKYLEKEWAAKCEQWCGEHKSCNTEIIQHAFSGASKREEYLAKKQEKEQKTHDLQRNEKIRSMAIKCGATILVLVSVGIAFWIFGLRQGTGAPKSEIVSVNGIHWHPHLSIRILGVEQEIPGGIGLEPTEFPIHTHEADGIIHLEFSGAVKEDDIRLGKFFSIWGKRFNGDCILDNCNSSDGRVKMLVNDEQNFGFENYIMRDGDNIEIIFE